MQSSNVRGFRRIHASGKSRAEKRAIVPLFQFVFTAHLKTCPPPPRPDRHHVGTQTFPPGACGDASTLSKIVSVCPEQHVMAEEGNSGDEMKVLVWSQGIPQAEIPQTGRGVDIPGPVSELQPSKAPSDCPQPVSVSLIHTSGRHLHLKKIFIS